MARYAVKEIYYTLQGEGARTGRAAVFCRFAGCNLWSGHEADRQAAVCPFCDTDFVGTDGPGGGMFDAPADLLVELVAAWTGGGGGAPGEGAESEAAVAPGQATRPYVVFTGGEPLLQLDSPLIAACHAAGFEVGVETNGTRPAPAGVDWLTVSPKAGAPLALRSGNELKLAFPQPGLAPDTLLGLDFGHYFLQPIDGPERERNTRAAVAYCLAHPRWRLSLQLHKLVGLP
jgi:7-carboxy-7-deazaguanine synthase (Cx14CxxC type)